MNGMTMEEILVVTQIVVACIFIFSCLVIVILCQCIVNDIREITRPTIRIPWSNLF